jgi:hypothetical protein
MPLVFKRAIGVISLLGVVIPVGLTILISLTAGGDFGRGYAAVFAAMTLIPMAVISFVVSAFLGREIMVSAFKYSIAISAALFGNLLWVGLLIYFLFDPGQGIRQKLISLLFVVLFVLPCLLITCLGTKWLLRWASPTEGPPVSNNPPT